jgi:hypothetical protein
MFDNTIFAVSDYSVHFLAAGSWRASGWRAGTAESNGQGNFDKWLFSTI